MEEFHSFLFAWSSLYITLERDGPSNIIYNFCFWSPRSYSTLNMTSSANQAQYSYGKLFDSQTTPLTVDVKNNRIVIQFRLHNFHANLTILCPACMTSECFLLKSPFFKKIFLDPHAWWSYGSDRLWNRYMSSINLYYWNLSKFRSYCYKARRQKHRSKLHITSREQYHVKS